LDFTGPEEDMVQRLKARFRQHSHLDWRYLRLESGKQRITVRMTRCFDPLVDWLRWLEAVSGVLECAMGWEAEEPDVRLEYRRADHTRNLGMLTLALAGREERFVATVSRTQIVAALYQAFRRFLEGSAYDARTFEGHSPFV
jgi:hypothetical protein